MLLLAGGAVALVAVLGLVLALAVNGPDDTAATTPPPVDRPGAAQSPGQSPDQPPGANADQGLPVAEGIYVRPAPGYLRRSLDKFDGVYLLKPGEGYFLVNAFAAGGRDTGSVLAELLAVERKATPGGFSAGTPREVRPDDADRNRIAVTVTQDFRATASTQSGSFEVAGFVAAVERDDGVVTVVRVFGRKDRAASVRTDTAAMLRSVIASQ